MTPCPLLGDVERFGGISCLLLQGKKASYKATRCLNL